MGKIKLLRRLLALLAVAVVTMSVFTGQDLDVTLTNLRRELYHDYKRIDKTRQQLNSRYEEQHQKMVGIVKKCNDMSLMIYSQKQDYTFDISYALERVTQEFNDFSKNRTPYEQIVANLDIEIIREVLVPVIVLCSIPTCAYWALDIFEFKDLYLTIFEKPFFTQGEFRVSIYSLLFLAGMFAVFRYANKGLHTLWQTSAYRHYLRKHNKKTVRNNEINLSLGNSLINVFVWFVYADMLIMTLHIPTGSLGLVAGGLSAGIGLALKDIINNFIYGIQIRFNDFGDSSVDVAVKQYVLVPERIGYIDRAKEVIYKALNENGISIPFPQCDVHMIAEDK